MPLARKRLAFSASGGASPLSLWNPAAFEKAGEAFSAPRALLFKP